MEIQRILARDTRTATDQAMSMYGRDVLIISNQRVNGQIELLVAVDIRPTDELDNVVTLDAAFVNTSDNATDAQAKPLNSFEAAFEETMMQRQRARSRGKAASPASTAKSLQQASVAPVVNLAAQAAPVPTAMVQTQHCKLTVKQPVVEKL
jgi:flagellar biosynthesis protein FlhF